MLQKQLLMKVIDLRQIPFRLEGGVGGTNHLPNSDLDEGLLESRGWFSARKVAIENGHFFIDAEPLTVESTLYGGIIGPLT